MKIYLSGQIMVLLVTLVKQQFLKDFIIIFQRLLFLKDKKFLNQKLYAMKHICSLVNRNLNLDCLRHVYTHNILDPIYRESKRICSIGDRRCILCLL